MSPIAGLRKAIFAHLSGGGTGLEPVSRQAIEKLQTEELQNTAVKA